MSGRKGGRPIPPATMTTSRPKASSMGQPTPDGTAQTELGALAAAR